MNINHALVLRTRMVDLPKSLIGKPCASSLFQLKLMSYLANITSTICLETDWLPIERLVVWSSSDMVIWKEIWINSGTIIVIVEQETCNICWIRIKGEMIVVSFSAQTRYSQIKNSSFYSLILYILCKSKNECDLS